MPTHTLSQRKPGPNRARRRSRRGTTPAPISPEPPTDDQTWPDAEEVRGQLLEQIAEGGPLCREIEAHLNQCPGPELGILIKLCRVLALKACVEAQAVPERLPFFSALMKATMECARLEETRKQHKLAEQKYRDELAARQTARTARSDPKVITPGTVKQIERELNLF